MLETSPHPKDLPAPSTKPSARLSQSERSATSDARMLDAAIALICEKGTDKTTLKEVGERAGYSRGLVSYRFGSKAGLFEFVIRALGEEWLSKLKNATVNTSGLVALEAAANAHFQVSIQNSDRVRAFYILWFDSIGPNSDVRDVIRAIHERRQHDVVVWLQRGIDEGTLPATTDVIRIARHYCAAIVGIVYQWLVDPENETELARAYADLMQSVQSLIYSS